MGKVLFSQVSVCSQRGASPSHNTPARPGWGTPLARTGWGTPSPVHDRSGYPPRPGQDGVPLPPPNRTAQRILATRAVCLFRKRRRTVLFTFVFVFPSHQLQLKLKKLIYVMRRRRPNLYCFSVLALYIYSRHFSRVYIVQCEWASRETIGAGALLYKAKFNRISSPFSSLSFCFKLSGCLPFAEYKPK